jgi:pyroglutamyl-peptidase
MKILVTGFEPFAKETINSALEAVKRLSNKINGAEVVKIKIPTIFKKSIEKLEKEIKKEKPDIVICVGQAGGRLKITVERVAINTDDTTIKDNEGNKPVDSKIFEDGANAYFSCLPIKAMVKEMTKKQDTSIHFKHGRNICM